MDDTPAQVAWWNYLALKHGGADEKSVNDALQAYMAFVKEEMERKAKQK
jgi:hypothetical protein